MRVACFAALLVMLAPAPALAQKSANVGSNPPGTAFYSVASGLSKIVTDAGAVKLTVQPYSGSSTFLPLLDSGELEFGVNNAATWRWTCVAPSSRAGEQSVPHTRTPAGEERCPLVGLLCRRIAPQERVRRDGQANDRQYPAHLPSVQHLGHLASAGLGGTTSVSPCPVTRLDAIVQGRARVTEAWLNSLEVRGRRAVGGGTFTSLLAGGEKRLRASVPGYYPRFQAGTAAAVVEDTS